MTYSNFYRTKGAKDKQPRKKRKKTRIETDIQRQINKAKRPFEPDPGILGRAVQYVKENPGKAFMGALGTAAVVATKGKKIAKGLEAIRGIDLRTLKEKGLDYEKLTSRLSRMQKDLELKAYEAKKKIDLALQPKTVKPSTTTSPGIPTTSNTPGPPTSASKPLPKQQGSKTTGVSEPKNVYEPEQPKKKRRTRRSRATYSFSPALSLFARTRGAKDERPRKRRRKTRLEVGIQRKIDTAKRMFEPEPTKFEKVVDYVKRNPMKTLATVGGTLYGAHLMKSRVKELLKDWKSAKNFLGFSYHDMVAEFARTRGAKDKRKRKKRYSGSRVRAIDSDKMKEIGDSEVIQESGKSEIDPKVKEAYLRAQTFRSRMNPIIYGVREARSIANMVGKMSRWKAKQRLSTFKENEGMPIVEDIIGKQIKGRGGIVKILAHMIGTEKPYVLDYKPKEYDSSNRYYERYATLLADPQSNLHRAKDVGGKPDREKSQVKGQQGIEAKKGKVSGSLLTRQYSSTYGNAEFEEKESKIAKLRQRFKKLASKGKRVAGEKYQQAKRGMSDLNLKRKAGTAALKTAYHTGRYAEKASRAKKRVFGD